MRTKAWLGLGTVLLSLLPGVGYAQSRNEALVQELYVKSGMEKQLEQLPLAIKASFHQAAQKDEQARQLSPNVIAVVEATVLEAFAPQAMKEAILPQLQKKLKAQEITRVLTWLDSPLGKKCTQLEIAADSPEAVAELQQYEERMKESPPTPARLKIIEKLDAAIFATESAVEIALGNQLAVALAINATLPAEQQRRPREILSELERNRPEIVTAAKSETLASLLYTYQSLTEAEIQQYIEFADSPAGAKYQKVSTAAFTQALFDASIKWGKSIGEALKRLPSQTNV